MAIDLGSSNSSRWYSTPDHDDFDLPSNPTQFTWFAISRPDYTNNNGSTNHYYIISNGAISDTDSYHLYISSSSKNINGSINAASSNSTGVAVPGSEWVLTWLKKENNKMVVGYQGIDDSTDKAEHIDLDLFGPYEPANALNIGRRGDANADRYFRGYIMYVGYVTAAISAADFTSLATGTALDSFSWYSNMKFGVHFDTAAATLTDHIGNKTVTRNGTGWATVADPTQINLTTPATGGGALLSNFRNRLVIT